MDIFGLFDYPILNNLEIIDIVEFGFPRLRYERANYFDDMDNFQFFKRFRLTKQSVLNVLVDIEEQLEYPHDL